VRVYCNYLHVLYVHFANGILHSWNESTFKFSVRASTGNNGMYFNIYKIGLNLKFKCTSTWHMQHVVGKTDVILSIIIFIYFTTLREVGRLKMVSPYTRLCCSSTLVQGMWLEIGQCVFLLRIFRLAAHKHKTSYDFLFHDLGHCLLTQRHCIRWTME
jgi:hypothetical protein